MAPPPTLFQKLSQIWFGITLASAILTAWVILTLTMTRFQIYPPKIDNYARQFCILVVHWSWYAVVLLNPQITVELEGFEEWQDKMRSDNGGRPIALLANHSSFMDTIVLVAMSPWYLVLDFKTLFKNTLMDIPVFGDLASACRHIPVYFLADVSGKFSVDPAKREKTNQLLDEHLSAGRVLSMFPEGTMNRTDTREVQPFRYGSFKALLKHDADLYGCAMLGCANCWPVKAQMGGFPGKLVFKLFPIASHGCRAMLNGKEPKDEEFTEECKIVADKTREVFQDHLNKLMKAHPDVNMIMPPEAISDPKPRKGSAASTGSSPVKSPSEKKEM